MTIEEFSLFLQQKDNSILYKVEPDDIKNWEGLIDAKDNFYSCDFGGHNLKAYHLIQAYYEDFGYKKCCDVMKNISADKVLDKLIGCGWIATRYLPTIGKYIDFSHDQKNFTDEQIKKIFDVIEKYKILYVKGLNELVNYPHFRSGSFPFP